MRSFVVINAAQVVKLPHYFESDCDALRGTLDALSIREWHQKIKIIHIKLHYRFLEASYLEASQITFATWWQKYRSSSTAVPKIINDVMVVFNSCAMPTVPLPYVYQNDYFWFKMHCAQTIKSRTVWLTFVILTNFTNSPYFSGWYDS